MASSSSRLHLGTAYYPDHWPEDRWPEEIRLMREAGLTVARLAEFAWSTLEPVEGEFHFDWLDRAILMLAEAGKGFVRSDTYEWRIRKIQSFGISLWGAFIFGFDHDTWRKQ